jgi:hypothetical protein
MDERSRTANANGRPTFPEKIGPREAVGLD